MDQGNRQLGPGRFLFLSLQKIERQLVHEDKIWMIAENQQLGTCLYVVFGGKSASQKNVCTKVVEMGMGKRDQSHLKADLD